MEQEINYLLLSANVQKRADPVVGGAQPGQPRAARLCAPPTRLRHRAATRAGGQQLRTGEKTQFKLLLDAASLSPRQTV